MIRKVCLLLIILLFLPFFSVSAVSTVNGNLQTGDLVGVGKKNKTSKKKFRGGYLAIKRKQFPKNEKQEIKVLGISKFFDGALLRGNDNKIFVVDGDMRRHIRSLVDLQKHRGEKIFDVGAEVLEDYPLKVFQDGDLVRGSDMRIFVVQGNTKKHILNLEELRKNYAGQEIFDVGDDLIVMLESRI